MAELSGRSLDHSGVAHVVVKLVEVNKSDFEKIKSKNFKKGRIRSWYRHVKAEIEPSVIEEKPMEMLDLDISSRAIDKSFKETIWAS
jgi:hypothetical protein